MTAYVYGHFRKSDNQLFYVGRGVGRRAWSTKGRTKSWDDQALRDGYTVVILVLEQPLWPVKFLEASAIQLFLRLGCPLVNVQQSLLGNHHV